MSKINLQELKKGDVFSELSHFTFQGVVKDKYNFIHHSTGETISLNSTYVEDLLVSGNIYQSELKVGKEDKFWTAKQIETALAKGEIDSTVRVGDIRVEGIRTIWENIHSQHVFTVCFEKAPKVISAKSLAEQRQAQIDNAVALIEQTAKSKKGVAEKAAEVIKEIQNNPILPIEKGEDRILTGYKLQFQSRDGKYDCMDMAINEPRPVNINTIKSLIFKGIKYIVE